MRKLGNEKDNGATSSMLATKLEEKIHRKQRQIRENLRQNRDSYWTEVAKQLEKAYEAGQRYEKVLQINQGSAWPTIGQYNERETVAQWTAYEGERGRRKVNNNGRAGDPLG